MRKAPLIFTVLLALNTGYVGAQEEVVSDRKPGKEKLTTDESQASVEDQKRTYLLKLLGRAVKGDPEAAYQLGQHYHAGVYVDRDPKKALMFYEKAANAGSPEAMYQIGVMYFFGADVEQDPAKAIKRDSDKAIKRDTARAITWFKKAIETDNDFLPAYLALGYIYLEPTPGQQRDLKQAEHYYGYAAKQGNIEGMAYLGEVYVLQDKFGLALPYLKKAVDQGSAVAKVHLAYMYLYGKGIEKDIDQAVKYAREAIEAKDQPMSAGDIKVAGIVYQQGSLIQMRRILHKDDE